MLTRSFVPPRGIAVAVIALSIAAPAVVAEEGYRLLFGSANGSLPESDQRAIYASLNLETSPNGAGLKVKELGCPAFLFDEVAVQDLDGDGRNEVVLRGGNTCTSGGVGSSVWLLTRSAQGIWQTHLGFPAGGYTVLAEKHLGLPDIRTGGMGWCEAVWRWDGQTYQHLKNVPTQPGGCDHLP